MIGSYLSKEEQALILSWKQENENMRFLSKLSAQNTRSGSCLLQHLISTLPYSGVHYPIEPNTSGTLSIPCPDICDGNQGQRIDDKLLEFDCDIALENVWGSKQGFLQTW